MSAGSLFTYVESKEALFHLVFTYALELLPETPELPLPTPAPGETLALFAHAHVLRILAACWIGCPPGDGRSFALATAWGLASAGGSGTHVRNVFANVSTYAKSA